MTSQRNRDLAQASATSRECIVRNGQSMRESDAHIVRSKDAVERSLELLCKPYHRGVEERG